MSIQEIASLAEVLGVFGVLASLLYVGRQVQQNTLQMRVAASSDRLQMFLQFWFKIAGDREFAALWNKGDSELSTLDEVDQLRILSFETAGLTVWSQFFDLHQAQLLSDDKWKEQLRDIETIGQRESVRTAWEFNKSRFSQSFQQFMSKYAE